MSHFRFHKKPITSVEWAPDDENCLAVACADNSISVWDMSLEADDEAELVMLSGGAGGAGGAGSAAAAEAAGLLPSRRDPALADIPPQLLFLHQGQEDVKEVHWHKQLPGVLFSTAADGMNVWKPDITVTT